MMRAGFNPPEGWEAIFRRVIALTSPSIGLCQKIDVTGLKFGEAAKDFRCKRGNMNHSIGFGAQNYNGKRERPGLVVLRKLFIHRQKHIKFGGVGDEAKELAVADAGPTGLGNSSDAVGRKLKGQILRKAFVEQEAHSGVARRPWLARSRKATACLRETVGYCCRNSPSVSPPSM